MTLLERLKELNATTGRRNGNEDLGHWADREKRENMWVRDVALPDLIAVVEAAEAVEASATAAYNARRMNVSRNKFDVLSAALAKLEVEA